MLKKRLSSFDFNSWPPPLILKHNYQLLSFRYYFHSINDLHFQISLHTSNKAFQCEFCNKEFARKYSLTVHRRIHTGVKDYKCDICSMAFRASNYLLEHKRIHTGKSENSTSSTLFVGKWQIHSDRISQYNYYNHHEIYNVTTTETRISKESKSNFFILYYMWYMLGQ